LAKKERGLQKKLSHIFSYAMVQAQQDQYMVDDIHRKASAPSAPVQLTCS
jgi:hypothetical protein